MVIEDHYPAHTGADEVRTAIREANRWGSVTTADAELAMSPGPDDQPPAPPTERRRFLGAVLASFQAATAFLLGLPAVRFLLSPILMGSEPAAWIQLAPSSAVGTAAPTPLRYRRRWRDGYRDALETGIVWLERRGDRLVALSATCTHLGCQVSWEAGRRQFSCPCHGGRYDVEGNVVHGPPPRPLASVPVKEERGFIWIQPPSQG